MHQGYRIFVSQIRKMECLRFPIAQRKVLAYQGAVVISGSFQLCVRTELWPFLWEGNNFCLVRIRMGVHFGIWLWSCAFIPLITDLGQLSTENTFCFNFYLDTNPRRVFPKAHLMNKAVFMSQQYCVYRLQKLVHFQNIISTAILMKITCPLYYCYTFVISQVSVEVSSTKGPMWHVCSCISHRISAWVIRHYQRYKK